MGKQTLVNHILTKDFYTKYITDSYNLTVNNNPIENNKIFEQILHQKKKRHRWQMSTLKDAHPLEIYMQIKT